MHAAVLLVGRPHAACDHLPRLLSRRHQSATLESNREHVDGMRNVITESGGGDDRGKKSETSESAPPSSAMKSRSAKAGTPQRIVQVVGSEASARRFPAHLHCLRVVSLAAFGACRSCVPLFTEEV